MKIAFGMKRQEGPFGGGNQFAISLVNYLEKNNVQVVYELIDRDIDLILLTDPRAFSKTTAFSLLDIYDYITKINSNCLVVHRINECDERKNSLTVNKQLALGNSIADHTIYIAAWLIDLFKKQGYSFSSSDSVIKNGGSREIFKYRKKSIQNGEKIKLVTHHWSDHLNKGWDIYLYLDQLLSSDPYKNNFEFHYIGKVPRGIQVNNIILHAPCSGKALADQLQQAHIYLTASLNEPGGMHHIEGALCGLPLLYINSGALPGYCKEFGVMFESESDFIESLDKIIDQYDCYADRLKTYPNTASNKCCQYFEVFQALIDKREPIVNQRKEKIYDNSFRNHLFFRLNYYKLLNKLFKIR